MSKTPRYWKPLVRATQMKAPTEELIKTWMKHLKCSREEAIRQLDADMVTSEIWLNDLYQVMVHRGEHIVHLNIRLRSGGPILRDWRHFQEIKNQLVGPECEGVELYPAESRLVDTSNKFHIYCLRNPKDRFPFGFETRQVSYAESKEPGLRQRSR